MSKRYTIVLQVCEVDEHGVTIECFDVMGPTLATTDLGTLSLIARDLEEGVAILMYENLGDTISVVWPDEEE